MNVNKVTATVRYSAEAKGAWRSIEVGAEATIGASESWKDAQVQLYRDLGQQLRILWTGNGAAPQDSPEANRMPVQPSSAQSGPRDGSQQHPDTHYCQEHGVPFKARTGPHGEFYSHQIKGTRQWCNEAKR